MIHLRICAVTAVLFSLLVIGGGVTTQKPMTMDLSSSTEPPSSSAAPTTTPPTETTDTTTPKPTTTTSTTTTTKPTTTTTTTTTTPVPPKPTPPPSPKPFPAPEQGNWSYTGLVGKTNVTCILVQFAAQLNVTYTKNVQNSTVLDHVLVNVPPTASVSGSCNGTNSTQWLQLDWTAPNTTTPNTLLLVFQKDEATKNYKLQALNVSLSAELFPNTTSQIDLWNGNEWQTPLSTSYRCEVPTALNLTSGAPGLAAGLTLTHLQEEAFRSTQGSGFSVARECGGGDLPDAVPIIVGCALGGLVLVVLVAYLVGRRGCGPRGYLSM